MPIKIELSRELLTELVNAKITQLKRKQVAEFNPMIKEIIAQDINTLQNALNTAVFEAAQGNSIAATSRRG